MVAPPPLSTQKLASFAATLNAEELSPTAILPISHRIERASGAGASRNPGGSPPDTADLGALKAQIVHQSLLIKDEGDDRAGKAIRVNRTARADRDHHD
jgi:hypothetical protein